MDYLFIYSFPLIKTNILVLRNISASDHKRLNICIRMCVFISSSIIMPSIVFPLFPSILPKNRAQKIRTTTITKNLYKTNLPKEYYVNKLTDKTLMVEELQKCIQELQAQLADAQLSAAMNKNVNTDQIMASLLAQTEIWKHRIDKIYDDIRSAQENFFTMSSKEKILKLRTKYKEFTEQNRKLFSIDGESTKRVSANAIFLLTNFRLLFNHHK